jgi:hypothetical protein
MDVGGRTLHFLDLLISIVNNRIETTVYSKPTDAHLYLNANSSHPKSQILGIAKGLEWHWDCLAESVLAKSILLASTAITSIQKIFIF